jgi:hypothetical protein
MRILLALLFAVLLVDDARACSCVKRSFAEHAKTEKRVFLAKAGKPVKKGDALKQTFTILATFKGDANATEFVLDRPATPPCKIDFAEGDIAILFTTSGDIDPCHGNEPIASQAPELQEILKASGVTINKPQRKVIDDAVANVLVTYKRALKNVSLDRQFTAGNITFASGKIAKEGVRFHFVLLLDNGTWTVIHKSVVEI